MRTGPDIRAARERAGLTQEQLAQLVGVTQRSIGNWERDQTVPRNRLAKIEEVLRPYLGDDEGAGRLETVSDVELLAEIARRFSRTAEVVTDVVRDGDAANRAGRQLSRSRSPYSHAEGDVQPRSADAEAERPSEEPWTWAARPGTPDNPPDVTSGEESQDPGVGRLP